MRPFPSSNGYTYILVAVDNVTKWVEAIPTSSADHNTSIKVLKEVIFPRFGVPRYLMTYGGSHFIQGVFRKMLAKYDVYHRMASPYHPQSSGQVELSNREIKLILQKNMSWETTATNGAMSRLWFDRRDEHIEQRAENVAQRDRDHTGNFT